ncbi:MAG TPA: dihydrofolate reductase family protein [Thermoanaerobaculia bacterium]|nr:dihydrofolate reductase family protein [Thermoanaerobaculia bacterium]
MRKLKVQMQITVDGFVADPEGGADWMSTDTDPRAMEIVNQLTDASDTLLMGRKMAPGFVKWWESIKPESPEYAFAQKMVNIRKIVFSRTIRSMEGRNVRVENGPLVESVNRLKSEPGKDIVVYGGASFVSSLIENGLVDEFDLVVNPVAIGSGMRIFGSRVPLKLTASVAFANGEVLNTYEPKV